MDNIHDVDRIAIGSCRGHCDGECIICAGGRWRPSRGLARTFAALSGTFQVVLEQCIRIQGALSSVSGGHCGCAKCSIRGVLFTFVMSPVVATFFTDSMLIYILYILV